MVPITALSMVLLAGLPDDMSGDLTSAERRLVELVGGAERPELTAAERRLAALVGESAEPARNEGPKAERTAAGYRYQDMRVPTKLPVGYPAPTPPGVIEVKAYPEVRRAEVTVAGGPTDRRASNGGFWPLFRHITSRDIAMTAPVEMDFVADEDGSRRSTMSFLYERFEDGPIEDAENNVRVVDAEPVTVVSLGMRGRPSSARLREAVQKLEAWAGEQADWASTGRYRWLGYNGPEMPADRQWYEIQVILEDLRDTSVTTDARDGHNDAAEG